MKKTILLYIGIIFSGFYFLFQLYLISNYIDVDVVNYYLEIKNNNLFHPHHLFYNFTGWLFIELTKDFLKISDFLKLKIMNILAGSISTSLLLSIFYKFSKKIILSILFTFYVVFSFDFWFYSQINDTAFFTLFGVIIYFFFLSKITNFRITNSLFIGFIHSIAIGYHQTNLFLYFITVFYILFKTKEIKKSILFIVFYSISFIFFTSIFYIFIGHYIYGYSFEENTKSFIPGAGKGNFFDWIFMYGHWDISSGWGTFERKNLIPNIIVTFSHSLFFHTQHNIDFYFKNLSMNLELLKNFEFFLYFIFIISFFITIISSIIFIFFKKNFFILGIFFWLFSNTLLVSWWEPTNKEFWLVPLFGFIFLKFLNITELIKILKKNYLYYFFYIILCYFIFTYLSLIFFQNYYKFFEPRKQKFYIGHWEDLRDQNYFANIMNSDFKIPFNNYFSNEHLIIQKLKFLETLKYKLSITKNKTQISNYILHYEKTLESIQKLLEQEADQEFDISSYYKELELLKNNYDEWLEYYKKLKDNL